MLWLCIAKASAPARRHTCPIPSWSIISFNYRQEPPSYHTLKQARIIFSILRARTPIVHDVRAEQPVASLSQAYPLGYARTPLPRVPGKSIHAQRKHNEEFAVSKHQQTVRLWFLRNNPTSWMNGVCSFPRIFSNQPTVTRRNCVCFQASIPGNKHNSPF